MARQFEEAAFSAAPGTLVRPFETQFGWHVMYVVE
jgi:parvulin-like peptidyl-prolyl isomerase